MKKAYLSPMTQTLVITSERFIAYSTLTANGSNAEVDISRKEYNDEFAVKNKTYNVWDDDWSE